jgi:hypothetical protein
MEVTNNRDFSHSFNSLLMATYNSERFAVLGALAKNIFDKSAAVIPAPTPCPVASQK